MQKEDKFFKGSSCPQTSIFLPKNQVKTKKRSSRSQAVDSTETFQNFSWKNDLARFHSLYNAEKEDIWPFFGVLGGQTFFGQKGGYVFQKEDVWYITLDLNNHWHTVLDITGSSTIKHRK